MSVGVRLHLQGVRSFAPDPRLRFASASPFSLRIRNFQSLCQPLSFLYMEIFMKFNVFCLTLVICFLSIPAFGHSETVCGKWKTYDDTSGDVKSVVHIYQEQGEIFGKIIKLFRGPDEDSDPVCEECTGALKNRKILGMQIIKGLKQQGPNEWSGGTILDPENGKTYDCKLWLEKGKLKVRGYLLFFYRTQTWERVTE